MKPKKRGKKRSGQKEHCINCKRERNHDVQGFKRTDWGAKKLRLTCKKCGDSFFKYISDGGIAIIHDAMEGRR